MKSIIDIKDLNEISLNDAKSQVILYKGEVFEYFDEGCTRYVYTNADNTKVIKILKSDRAVDYNQKEYDIYENAKPADKELMVETHLMNGVIEQKFVMPVKWAGKKLTLPQIRFAKSCRNEVGWDGDKLVCFDLDEYKKY